MLYIHKFYVQSLFARGLPQKQLRTSAATISFVVNVETWV